MTETRLRVVVLGGGTAGWMAANLFAHRLGPRAAIDVVESSEIGIVGVGEGSTPQLKAFFDGLGIAEAEWMPRCNATYKNGIAFRRWSERPGFESYFHPFAAALDDQTAPPFYRNTELRRRHRDVPAHPDRFLLPARLAAERRAPRPGSGTTYGYHFDAHLVGAFLREHALGRGVRRHDRKVVEVAVADGQVAALRFEGGGELPGDLFVDASGFRSMLAQETLGVRWIPFASNLFNDRAVVAPTPADPTGTASQTTATALRHGWAWDIPLTNRTGNGYVYSSAYCSPDDAEAELRAHLGLSGEAPVRHLRMRVGRVADTWSGNVLAVGLAQGFIEPLEATALHLVQATVEGFLRAWEDGRFTPEHRDAFNRTIAVRYEGIRDYIVCHYRVNRRADTTYWRDNAAQTDLSDSLKGVLTAWFRGRNLETEVLRQGIARYYAPLSWHCLLAGYGTYPSDDKLTAAAPGEGADMREIDRLLAAAAASFPDHKATLAALA